MSIVIDSVIVVVGPPEAVEVVLGVVADMDVVTDALVVVVPPRLPPQTPFAQLTPGGHSSLQSHASPIWQQVNLLSQLEHGQASYCPEPKQLVYQQSQPSFFPQDSLWHSV